MYETSQMYQNQNISPECLKNTFVMDKKTKQELSKANFKLGTFVPNFKTVFQTDYEPKSPVNGTVTNPNIKFGNNLRSHSFRMGDDLVDYMSDNKLRYSNPNVKERTQ